MLPEEQVWTFWPEEPLRTTHPPEQAAPQRSTEGSSWVPGLLMGEKRGHVNGAKPLSLGVENWSCNSTKLHSDIWKEDRRVQETEINPSKTVWSRARPYSPPSVQTGKPKPN